jgi:hypothetical protein
VWRLDAAWTPHTRHVRQDSDPGAHDEHGGEHGDSPNDALGASTEDTQ